MVLGSCLSFFVFVFVFSSTMTGTPSITREASVTRKVYHFLRSPGPCLLRDARPIPNLNTPNRPATRASGHGGAFCLAVLPRWVFPVPIVPRWLAMCSQHCSVTPSRSSSRSFARCRKSGFDCSGLGLHKLESSQEATYQGAHLSGA